MCLVTFDPTVHIAEEDMVVYKQGIKVEESVFSSGFFTFSYKQNTLYETKIKKGIFHYFDCIAERMYNNMEERYLQSFGAGFHSAFTKERFDTTGIPGEDSIAEFIIPKGSEYIKDETGLLVSNKIIFKQWV